MKITMYTVQVNDYGTMPDIVTASFYWINRLRMLSIRQLIVSKPSTFKMITILNEETIHRIVKILEEEYSACICVTRGEGVNEKMDYNMEEFATYLLSASPYGMRRDILKGFLEKQGVETDNFDEFILRIKKLELDNATLNRLIPSSKINCFKEYKISLINMLTEVKNKVLKFQGNYVTIINMDEIEEKSLLDVLLEEGIFPTYSFPRNVVGFEIEENYGRKLAQEPDRSLDLAISEYAPGRIIVVDKKTYKSGGIFNFHSKFNPEYKNNPARPYFNNLDYFKNIYYCSNKQCNWVDTARPSNGKCPFCGNDDIKEQYLLKPWGFAPIEGKNINDAEADAEMSYAELPCYSAPIVDEDMITYKNYKSLRFGRLENQSLLIMNQGPNGEGFTICKDCGAAVPGNNEKELKKLSQPFTYPYNRSQRCYHSNGVVNTFLGHQFLTDMVLFEIKLDNNKIDVSEEGMWIKSAALSLSEAMVLAASQLLDVDFNDIKAGYRIRSGLNETYVDIYLFDSLSSGAGYSSMLPNKIEELFNETMKVLSCKNNCKTSCHDCLNHFWNQRVQYQLDRHLALQLLKWAVSNELPNELPFTEQKELIIGLKELAFIDQEFDISVQHDSIKATNGSTSKEIVIYPSMLNINDNSKIFISDKMITKALPMAYSKIRKSII